MKNRFVLAAGGALIVVAGSLACSATGRWVSSADPSAVQLTVDGQPQAVQGAVTCNPTHVGDHQIILVGSQINVELSGDASQVFSVGIHTDTVNLQYFKSGYDGGHASGTRTDSTYDITGNITGSGLNGALKPFELNVTCP